MRTTGSITVVDVIHAEVLAMLVEARDCFVVLYERQRNQGDHFKEMALTAEKLRVTSRLATITSWVLFHKAHGLGEVDEPMPLHGLKDTRSMKVCAQETVFLETGFPPGLRDILDRSHGLYLRVALLDEMNRDSGGNEYVH